MLRKLLFISLIFSINYSSYAGIKVRVSNVSKMEFFKMISVPAKCTSKNSKDYFAAASGFVSHIPVTGKKNFAKGELIFAIDKDLYTAQMDLSKASLKSASMSFERDKKLYEKKIISDEAFEKSKIAYYTAKSSYENTKKLYENMVIYAENNVEISSINFKLNDQISASEYILTLYTGYDKLLKFSIPSSYKIDDKNADAYVVSNLGRIKADKISISNILDSKSKGYNSFLEISKENNLQHNSFVSAEIIYNKHIGLGVPENALIKEDGKSKIFIKSADNIAKKIEITTGDRVNNFIEVISDEIDENSIIVTQGFQKLSGGEKIDIIE